LNLDYFYDKEFKYYLFDLDNTLYNENIYLFTAYFKIANYLDNKYRNNSRLEYYHFLIDEFLRSGRINLFQKFFNKYRINEGEIDSLLKILRTQNISPKIELKNDIYDILKQLLSLNKKLAIITNGSVQQQKNKVAQINWKGLLNSINVIYAEEYESKPGIQSFSKITSEFNDFNLNHYLFIGDSVIDKQFAENCKIHFVGVGDLLLYKL